MKTSEIRFHIELDDENVPEKLFWSATDSPNGGLEEAKAINVSIWDHRRKETLRIDLWAKDMPVDEMKRLAVDTLGSMAQTIRTATDDGLMAAKMEDLCTWMMEHIRREHSSK